jgi:predicted NBD/HSP70 family sugar kinase
MSDVRRRNEKLVLRLIHGAGEKGLSQSEAALATGLKPPTIFRIFSSLEELGYIEAENRASAQENDSRQDRKGRRPLAYFARKDAFYFIGVEFWVEQVSLGVFDFLGTPVYSRTVSLQQPKDALVVIDLIADLAREAITSLSLRDEKILGIGIGAPGQVNVGSRKVTSYPRIPGMKDFAIASILEEKLGFPVFLHNNCSVIALSEFRYGNLGEMDSMFMFLLRSGVNGAFIDGGKVFLSPRGTTIEMGHISIDYEGPKCICGAHGCLEAFMVELDRDNSGHGRWLFDGIEGGGSDHDSKILDTASSYIASAAQTVCRLFRPTSFLIVAHDAEIAGNLARLVGERLSREASIFDETRPKVFGRPYDVELAQRGAADLVLDAFLS